MRVLITGTLGLVGSEAAKFYLAQGHQVIGVDNNMRKTFFGQDGCGLKNMIQHPNYTHCHLNIAHTLTEQLFVNKPEVIIHAAAQPSHDWAANNPLLDFEINAMATLKLLDACRKYSPDSVFVYLSTNKVYGDRPNNTYFTEFDTRYDCPAEGFGETTDIDQCTHSLFGVSKLAGDLYAQEYAKYFGLKTGIFRCGCITGPQHSGAELHGFLAYMVKCKKEGRPYKIYGYKGKQVRDNIHAYDLVTAIDAFVKNPRPGEVYNMGGSRHSNISVMEALSRLEMHDYEYIDQARRGDHKWYISDVSKFKSHYPEWKYKYDMEGILEELMA